MTISAFSPLKDGVIAVTGGTAVPFTSLGDGVGENVVFFDGADMLTRKEARFQATPPKVNAGTPSGYTQSRNKVILLAPQTLTSGERVVNKLTIHLEADINMSSADKSTLRGLAAQILSESDLDNFWNSLACS
jgi:hypothetical protein